MCALLAQAAHIDTLLLSALPRCRVEFRGSHTDDAALVTRAQTYSVRLVESSNTQLLVCIDPARMFDGSIRLANAKHSTSGDTNPAPMKRARLDAPPAAAEVAPPPEGNMPVRVISGMVEHHYEVCEVLPRLHVLRELLTKNLYNDNEEELIEERAAEAAAAAAAASEEGKSSSANGEEERRPVAVKAPPALYTSADLRHLIQSSDEQLKAGLLALNVSARMHQPRKRSAPCCWRCAGGLARR
jgi:hypothetical protein